MGQLSMKSPLSSMTGRPKASKTGTSTRKGLRFLASLAMTPLDGYINRIKIKLPGFWASRHHKVAKFLIIFLGPVGGGVVMTIICLFLPALLAVILFSALARREVGREVPGDGQTHCRKCGYILRGVQEPRCSECGEPI
mgnify:CR=1 FL=1